MKMKKILFSILAVFILMVAVACGKKEAPTEDANAQQEAASISINTAKILNKIFFIFIHTSS